MTKRSKKSTKKAVEVPGVPSLDAKPRRIDFANIKKDPNSPGFHVSVPATPPQNIAKAAIATGMAALQAQIERLAAEKDLDRDKASHLAWLLKQIAQVQAEQRKQEAADRKAGAELEHQDVLAYLRQLEKSEWTEIRGEVDEHHKGGRLFG